MGIEASLTSFAEVVAAVIALLLVRFWSQECWHCCGGVGSSHLHPLSGLLLLLLLLLPTGQVLGGGIDVVVIGSRTYIRSVPGEFNMDKNRVMELAQQQGYISAGESVVGWGRGGRDCTTCTFSGGLQSVCSCLLCVV